MKLLLGTAQWGWTVAKAQAFQLLDAWLQSGHRGIDTATNYPINKQPGDFRAAERILKEYIQAHGIHDLQITVKVGSLDNLRSPEANLSPSFLLMMAGEYQRRFGQNLHGFMLHWDNRSEATAIQASLEALAIIQNQYALQPGLSGIAHPEIYAQLNTAVGFGFDIQLKHNIFQSDVARYQPLYGSTSAPVHVFAYGIQAGGIKLGSDYRADSTYLARGGQPEMVAARLEQLQVRLPGLNLAFVRPPIKTMAQIGLIYANLHPRINGVVLGLSSVQQLQVNLEIQRDVETFDYSDVFETLDQLRRSSN